MKRNGELLLLGIELDAQDRPVPEMVLRAQTAARAYAAGKAQRIIACGGVLPGHGISEAQVLKELLTAQGVPEERIVLETRSQDTMGNLNEAAALMGGANGRHVVIVTSSYHMLRAKMTARRVGFIPCGIAAPMPEGTTPLKTAKLHVMEAAYCLDLLLGYQDGGKRRPVWAERAFDAVFGSDHAKKGGKPGRDA